MTPDKQLDALVSMFPDHVWRNPANGRLCRKDTCLECDPLTRRDDILNLIKLPVFFPRRKTFVQELVYVMDRDFGGEPSIDASDAMQPTEVAAWLMLDATAPQVLEAVLLAGGVWEEQGSAIDAQPDPYAELKAARQAGKVIQFIGTRAAKAGDWSFPLDLLPSKEPDWDYPIDCFRIKPDAPSDPYAKLKEANKIGKMIQSEQKYAGSGYWLDCEPDWSLEPVRYRVKPDAPSIQLPPPPPGMQWHREDGWTMDMLPFGWRPLTAGEKVEAGDETPGAFPSHEWQKCQASVGKTGCEKGLRFRTTRPLVFTYKGKQWTWHRPGDPMPCDKQARVNILLSTGGSGTGRGILWSWGDNQGQENIIGWRYAEPEFVDLGPEDVPPCSAVKGPSDGANEYALICGVGNHLE